MTRRDLLADAVARLAAAGVEDARRSAEWLLEEALGLDGGRAALLARPDDGVPPDAAVQFERMVARRADREPVQYVLGHTDFFGLRLAVTPSVLIPRPETEEVAEWAIRQLTGHPAPWVLDVGTGSGAIALAIKHARADAEVFACDTSTEALAVAAANAAGLGLEVAFAPADVLDPAFAAGLGPAFDLVVSNPPYVLDSERPDLQPEVRDWEPDAALYVPDADPLLFYRVLAALAPTLLKPGGHLVVETHADHGAEVRDLFAASGLQEPELRQDLSGRDRIVSACRAVEEG